MKVRITSKLSTECDQIEDVLIIILFINQPIFVTKFYLSVLALTKETEMFHMTLNQSTFLGK